MDICRGTNNDLQAILQLYQQLHPQEDSEVTPERQRAFAKILANDDNYLMVAKDEDKIIATAHLTILNNLSRNGRPAAYVENVVVDRQYRSQGVGEELLAHLNKLAAENNCYKIFLCTGTINNAERDKDREKRHRFYRKTGLQDGIKHAFVRYLDKNI